VLAEASRLGELCAWSRRNALGRLEVRVGEGADANTRDACAPRIPAPERPVFPAGSLAACEEPVLSLSKESHEAIMAFFSVGAKSELTAHAVDAFSFENGEWLHTAGWRGVRSFASSG